MRSRLTFQIACTVCAAFVAAGCGGSTAVSEVTGPDAVRCQTSVSAMPASIPAGGNRVTLTVNAARECTWSASSDASWLQVSPASGQGEGSLTLTIAANPEGRSRTAVVIVNNNRLSLAQDAAPCRYDVSPDEVRLSQQGGRGSFRVAATAACTWRATTNDSWLRVLNSSGSSDGTVEVEASANPANTPRVALVNIAGRNVTVTQDSEPPSPNPNPNPNPNPSPNPNPNPNPSPNCAASIDSFDRSFGALGGTGSFHVNVPDGCRWTATSNAGWVEITGSPTATRSDDVRYRVFPNITTSPRTAAIAVSGQTHVIRQEGVQLPTPPPANGSDRIDLSGRASSVTGSCPNLRFLLEGRSVFTTAETDFKGKGNCRDLQNLTRVSVDGRIQSDGQVRAEKVDIDDDDN